MRKSREPENGQDYEALTHQVEALMKAGRGRVAADEIIRRLRRCPEDYDNRTVRILAHTLLQSRTARLTAAEPMTDQQRECAILAPFLTECSKCRTSWHSLSAMAPELGMTGIHVANPRGLQCQQCRYSLCSDCLGSTGQGGEDIDQPRTVSGSCPHCRSPLTTPVLATGRRHVTRIEPDDVEAVIVVRDGLIPPTLEQAFPVVSKFLPLIEDDLGLIHIRRRAVGDMDGSRSSDRLAMSLVHDLEREGALYPGAWERSKRLEVMAGAARGGDYLLTVVRKSDRQKRPDWLADQVREHVQVMTRQAPASGQGKCWKSLTRADSLLASARVVDEALAAAFDSGELVTRHCAVDRLVVAATAMRIPDLRYAREQFPEGYVEYFTGLVNRLLRIEDGKITDNFVHWIVSTDDSTVKVDATVYPSWANRETRFFAVDMMSAQELRAAGL
ncbi:hypothetical protein [Streptacidiphilus carbonis]|uniref:hypothetical protein n=1 Tax=Streptacidiphilus carbonis TaxID=105422 RepID=UPI00069368F5|nr:hypothetical protein [Streptacidiphilus carbonis]